MEKTLFYSKCPIKYHPWSDNAIMSNIVWNLFGGNLYFVVFDPHDIGSDFYAERLDYYKSTYQKSDKIGTLDYDDNPVLTYKESFDLFPNSHAFGVFHIVKPADIKSVEGIFTFTSGDEEIHLFSEDFSIEEIRELFRDYAKDAFFKNGASLSDYFTINKKEIFSNKLLCMLDTYSDDEDKDNYYVITSSKEIYDKLMQ